MAKVTASQVRKYLLLVKERDAIGARVWAIEQKFRRLGLGEHIIGPAKITLSKTPPIQVKAHTRSGFVRLQVREVRNSPEPKKSA